jgi:RNA polymerase sigma-70 factor (ECF subfamily)
VQKNQEIECQLLKKIIQKDEDAFRKLYQCYQPKLLQFCTVQLNGDCEQAADIVDTVMFDVWNKAANYQTKATVNTWIHTIARYKVIDFLRKRRESQTAYEAQIDELTDHQSTPTQCIEATEKQQFYHHCLAQLKPKLKEVLLFIYNQAIPLKEVARLLDCPENTVKTRAFQARKKLQQCIQEVCQ